MNAASFAGNKSKMGFISSPGLPQRSILSDIAMFHAS
jgi:hypothetical protein